MLLTGNINAIVTFILNVENFFRLLPTLSILPFFKLRLAECLRKLYRNQHLSSNKTTEYAVSLLQPGQMSWSSQFYE